MGGVGFTPHYLACALYTIHNHSTTAQCPLQTLPRTYPSSTFHTLPTCPQELTNILILSIWGDIFLYIFDFKLKCRASLVAQWLRICLPMQGTRV